ncbi:OmpA family protein [Candidatus Dependentiae bacterium]
MNKYLSLLLVLSIAITGCKDKKKSVKGKKDKTTKVAQSGDIPTVYNYDDAELFAEGDINLLEDGLTPEGGTKQVDGETTVATADDVEKEIDQLISLWDEELPEKQLAQTEFKTINFDINKSDIKDNQEDVLEENVEMALSATKEGKKLVVQGHGCQTGSESWNMALSQKRAQIVVDQLVAKGVPSDKVEAVGMGSSDPLVWTDKTDRESLIAELAPNRRSEIIVVG